MIKADLWIPNIRGDLTLHEAVHSGRKDLVRWLLSQKSQNMVNVANNDGKCPLHIAAINNNVEMCKVICFVHYFIAIQIFTIFWSISFTSLFFFVYLVFFIDFFKKQSDRLKNSWKCSKQQREMSTAHSCHQQQLWVIILGRSPRYIVTTE